MTQQRDSAGGDEEQGFVPDCRRQAKRAEQQELVKKAGLFYLCRPLINFNHLPGSSMNVGWGRRDALHRQHHQHLES